MSTWNTWPSFSSGRDTRTFRRNRSKLVTLSSPRMRQRRSPNVIDCFAGVVQLRQGAQGSGQARPIPAGTRQFAGPRRLKEEVRDHRPDSLLVPPGGPA